MSALDPAKLLSRANSDMCAIGMILANTTLSPCVRMALIAERAREYEEVAHGSTGHLTALRKVCSLRERRTNVFVWTQPPSRLPATQQGEDLYRGPA